MWSSQAVSSGAGVGTTSGSSERHRRSYSPPRTPPGVMAALPGQQNASEAGGASSGNDAGAIAPVAAAGSSSVDTPFAGTPRLLGVGGGGDGVGISSAIMSRAGSLSGASSSGSHGEVGGGGGGASAGHLGHVSQQPANLLQQSYGRRQQYHHVASLSEDASRAAAGGGGVAANGMYGDKWGGGGEAYVLDMSQGGSTAGSIREGGVSGDVGLWRRLASATNALTRNLGLGALGGKSRRKERLDDRDGVEYVPLTGGSDKRGGVLNGSSSSSGGGEAGDGAGEVKAGGGGGGGAKKVSAAVIIPIWIALSSGVIVYNKWLYSTAGFPYPIFITSYHLGAAAVGTRLLRLFTPLMNGLDTVEMTPERYYKNIVPIGILFSGSLILSNTAYLTLSVSFIQMLKAFTPVSVLLTSALLGIQNLNARLMFIVILISLGTAMAAIGELHFELFGFVCQFSAVFFESSRLVMIQILLQGLKMDPLCSLHYYAPICAIINACFIPFTEGWAPFLAIPRIGFFVMFTNALNAFLLNVSAVFLIGAGGGLVLTLSGVFKDILLITSSTIFFGSSITPLQIVGYAVALTGLLVFKLGGGK